MVSAANLTASPLFHVPKSDRHSFSSSSSLSLKPRRSFFTNRQSFSSITTTAPQRSPVSIKACSSSDDASIQNSFTRHLTTAAATAVIVAVAMTGKFRILSARADTLPTVVASEENTAANEVGIQSNDGDSLPKLLESNPDAVEALKSLVKQKLEAGEDEESLKILKKLVSAEPENTEWKFLMARLLNEMGDVQSARQVFDEILKLNPLSFEALFENALLMDRLGEGDAVLRRLEEAQNIAEAEMKLKEFRDVKFIMAQIHFLQNNVEEALKRYEELAKEDPKDFRPYFCKGMIYSLLDKNTEAREEFAKYKELSPKKFEVEGYLRSPLSKMKLFGTGEDN